MALDIYELVSAASSDEIDPVVQSYFNDVSARAVPGWKVESMSAPSIGVGTLALMKVSGKAEVNGMSRPWSAVLKIMDCTPASHLMQIGSATREITSYKSGLFDTIGDGIRAAKAYFISEKSDNIAWLWTEDLSGHGRKNGLPWTAFQYLSTAEALGRFKGAMLQKSIQHDSWMNQNATVDRWTSQATMKFCGQLAGFRDNTYVRTALPGNLFSRAIAFEEDIQVLARAVENVPSTLAHGDFHVRNVFTRVDHDGAPEVIAIDLASVGIESLGTDLGSLIGASLTWGDDESDLIISNERETFDAFVSGLRSQRCEIPEETIRLGYLMNLCGYGRLAAQVPSAVLGEYGRWKYALERYGGSSQQLPFSYRRRIEFAISIFDEALELVKSMGAK